MKNYRELLGKSVQKLMSKFNGSSKAQEKTEQKKAADLAELSDWILETAKNIEKDADVLKQRVGQGRFGGCEGYSFSSDINFDQFTRQDLLALKPVFQKLHEVCKEQNIALDSVSGLDLLPRTYLATEGGSSIARPGEFEISVDARREYNFCVNPFADKKPETGPKLNP